LELRSNDQQTDFAERLIPVRGDALEHGDAVYEKVQWGRSEGDVKWKKWRVIRADGGSATVVSFDGPNRGNPHKKIKFGDLRMERQEQEPMSKPLTGKITGLRSVASGEAPSPRTERTVPPAAGDSQYEAWVEMGRGLVADVTGEQRGLAEQKAKILRDLDAIDGNHRKAIESLELDRAAREDEGRG